jgi:hypothetical protein
MATKRLISLRNNEALVKIEGAAGAVTIGLATDLLGAAEVLDGGTQTVTLAGIRWTSVTGTATIVRNGVTIASIAAGSVGNFMENFYDDGGKTNDIVVTTVTGEVQIWLKLHKVGGYKTMIQPEQFGSYDNPASASA